MQTQTSRTTVDLDWSRITSLKQIAISDRTSLKELINQAVGEYVEKRQVSQRRTPTEILKEMKKMSRWGKQGVNLTRAVIRERERLSKKGL